MGARTKEVFLFKPHIPWLWIWMKKLVKDSFSTSWVRVLDAFDLGTLNLEPIYKIYGSILDVLGKFRLDFCERNSIFLMKWKKNKVFFFTWIYIERVKMGVKDQNTILKMLLNCWKKWLTTFVIGRQTRDRPSRNVVPKGSNFWFYP